MFTSPQTFSPRVNESPTRFVLHLIERRCVACGVMFPTTDGRVRLCSDACRETRKKAIGRARQTQYRNEHSDRDRCLAVQWALVNVLLTATGLLLALRWMRQDAARQWRLGHPAQVRLMSGAVVAMLFSAALWANPYYTQCAEASG
jgi:predicted nucleic acid-binding Zn ribbon protein